MKMSAKFRKGLFGLSLLMLGALSTPALADAPWQTGKRFALIVGIDDYQNDSVLDLKCATSDAKLLRDTLLKEGEFEDENIFLLSSDSTGESSQPSLTNIVFRLEWLRDIVGPGDTLVFYFAGHGVSMDSETFLLTEEADQRSKGTLMISSLRGTVLNDLLKSAGAQNTLVLLDACRNDPTAGRGDASNTLSPALARGLVFKPAPAASASLARNTATVFACSEGERSWEWADKNQGFFTYFLAEALRDGAYDAKGDATLQSLVSYVSDKVDTAARRETNQGQKPMLRYEGPGANQWVIASSLDKAKTPVEKVAQAQLAQLAARAQKAELEKNQALDLLAASQAQAKLAAAKQEVEKKTSALASASDKAAAERDLKLAQDGLKIAENASKTAQQRVAFNETSQAGIAMRIEASELAEKIEVFGAQPRTPEIETMVKRLAELEQKLIASDEEKKQLASRALKAEKALDDLNADLDKRWGSRWGGRRPSRRTRPEDVWQVAAPEGDEATEL